MPSVNGGPAITSSANQQAVLADPAVSDIAVGAVPATLTAAQVAAITAAGGTGGTMAVDSSGNAIGAKGSVASAWLAGTSDYDIHEARLEECLTSYMSMPLMPLTDSTGYQGSSDGNIVEVSALYSPEGWNGYRYWMVGSPYTGSSANYENPCLLCSNDGRAWSLYAGLTQPLMAPRSTSEHLYDSGIFWSPDRQSMIILTCIVGGSGGFNSVYYTVWNGQGQPSFVEMSGTRVNTTAHYLNTPCLAYDKVNARWVMYMADNPNAAGVTSLVYMTSPITNGDWASALASGWTGLTTMTLNGITTNNSNQFVPGETSVWHFDMHQLPSGAMVGLMQTGTASGGNVYPMRIPNTSTGAPGLTDCQVGPPLRPLNYSIALHRFYRSTFVPTPAGWECWFGTVGLGNVPAPSCMLIGGTVRFDRSAFHAREDAKLAALTSAPASGSGAALPKWGGLLAYDGFGTGTTLGTPTATNIGNWTIETGTFAISAGTLTGGTVANNKAYLSAGTADVSIRAWVSVISSGKQFVTFRRSDANNFWRVGLDSVSNLVTVAKIVAGTAVYPTCIGAQSVNSGNVRAYVGAPPDELWVHCVGSSIKIYFARQLIAEINDGFNVTATTHGIQISDTTAKFVGFSMSAAQ